MAETPCESRIVPEEPWAGAPRSQPRWLIEVICQECGLCGAAVWRDAEREEDAARRALEKLVEECPAHVGPHGPGGPTRTQGSRVITPLEVLDHRIVDGDVVPHANPNFSHRR